MPAPKPGKRSMETTTNSLVSQKSRPERVNLAERGGVTEHLTNYGPIAKKVELRGSKVRAQGVGSMSNFLFVCPSWLTGLARTLDIAGLFNGYDYCTGLTSAQCDWIALTQDMDTIRKDFLNALGAKGDDPRTRLLTHTQWVTLRLEVMQREIARHEELIEISRRYYAEMREELEHSQETDLTRPPSKELSWAR